MAPKTVQDLWMKLVE